MKRFKLTCKHKHQHKTVVTIVDDEDAYRLRSYPYGVLWGGNNIPYLRRTTHGSQEILLHHEIFGGAHKKVYHLNGNSLDNRRSNLSLTPPKRPQTGVRYSDAMRMLNRLICGKPTIAAPNAV